MGAKPRPGKMISMTVVYLIQHGDKQPRPGDPGLTELGRMQATQTGRRLAASRPVPCGPARCGARGRPPSASPR